MRFNAAVPDGLIDRKAPDVPPKLNDYQLGVMDAQVEKGPIPAVDGVVRGRNANLAQWV